jgi:DNA-binding transcriptional MerR regulator
MAMEDHSSVALSSPGVCEISDPGAPPGCLTRPLTISEMARRFGLSQRALRFYENKGLLMPRRQGATRIYSPADIERLALVLKAKRLGFTLSEIRDMLTAPVDPSESGALALTRRQCFEQIRLLEQRKREIESALAELRLSYSSFYARMAGGSSSPAP